MNPLQVTKPESYVLLEGNTYVLSSCAFPWEQTTVTSATNYTHLESENPLYRLLHSTLQIHEVNATPQYSQTKPNTGEHTLKREEIKQHVSLVNTIRDFFQT